MLKKFTKIGKICILVMGEMWTMAIKTLCSGSAPFNRGNVVLRRNSVCSKHEKDEEMRIKLNNWKLPRERRGNRRRLKGNKVQL